MSDKHFDSIAQTYHNEVPAAVREHLINKWWSLVSSHFPAGARILDIGCGEGTNCRFLCQKGMDAYGVDASQGLVEEGRKRYPEMGDRIAIGDALNLRHKDNTFDGAVLIGVLHHIYSESDQKMAIFEAIRVVKPNGVVVIRESNLQNPLFRLYWNYIFPLTARIDRFGGENWIVLGRIREQFSTFFESASYFTFIPSFLPASFLPLAGRVEARLEQSRFSKFGAHYTVVLRKR